MPYATWCLSWLTNHLPHEFLVISVFLICIMIVILIVLVIVILFLLLAWVYVHVLTRLMATIPRILKRIAGYILYFPSRRLTPSFIDSWSHSTRSTGFKSSPPINPSALITPTKNSTSATLSKKSMPSRPTTLPPQNQNNIIANQSLASTVFEPNRSFIRFREQLYARVHIPAGTHLNDIFPPHIWEPFPKVKNTMPSASIPPISISSLSSTPSASDSSPSTARG